MSGNSDERVLRKVTDEAREDLRGQEPDWEKLESKLFARIASDRSVSVSLDRFAGRRRAWGFAAGGLAVAAAIAIFAGQPGSRKVDPLAETPSVAPSNADALVLRKGGGEVHVAGSVLVAGQSVRAGDVIDTQGASAFFERPNAVTWELEDSSKITVKRAGATLVLALDRGAVEAQVTPVPTGEAFAVDVSTDSEDAKGSVTRIAVHGTHLRVARVGKNRVVIDLTEGVVSVGPPPRSGSTYGTLVTAPAHVELDVTRPAESLVITHAEAEVRAPVNLAEAMATRSPEGTTAQIEARDARVQKGSPSPTSPSPAGHVPPSSVPTPKHPEPAPAVARPDPNAEDAVAAAVRACAASRPEPDPTVKVTVSSKLELRVNGDGFVEFARFDPPLVPEVQSCAATSIYKTRFPRSGTVSIPLLLE